ncbi:MAG: toxin-antitoxin system YwqK family antitoxin [Chitinophagaceae bacterium]
MAGLYEDKENTISNGTFYWFYSNGTLKSVGRYVHNKKDGVWLNYFQDKSLKDSSNYKDGNLIGSLGWYSNGFMRDSLNVDSYGTEYMFHGLIMAIHRLQESMLIITNKMVCGNIFIKMVN